MRAVQFMTIAVLSFGLPMSAAAQHTSGQQSSSTTATSSQSTSPDNQWVASGFAGGNFDNNASPSSGAFGGSIGYLWHNRWGAEFDTGFTPNFGLQSNFFGLGIKPMVNSYMGNFVASVPFGVDHNWQPFVSGGAGVISLRSGLSLTDASGNAVSGDATRFGGDIGGGIMGFRGNWGLTAALEYLRAASSYQTSAVGYTTSSGGSTASPTSTPGTTPTPSSPSPSPTPTPVGPY